MKLTAFVVREVLVDAPPEKRKPASGETGFEEMSSLAAIDGMDFRHYGAPTQAQIDWLFTQGVPIEAMIRPQPMRLARGRKAPDGLFDDDPAAAPWLAFPEPYDIVYWQPKTGDLATWCGHAFALGEAAISNPATLAFDRSVAIHASPISWLRAKRDGIVIVRWELAFDLLRDCPRIAIAEGLFPLYKRHMRPAHMPKVTILADRSVAA